MGVLDRLRHSLGRQRHVWRMRRYPFIDVVFEHYRERLGALERTSLAALSPPRLRAHAEETASLHRVLTDLQAESYQGLAQVLDVGLHARPRLESLLDAALSRLGTSRADQPFSLHRGATPPFPLDESGGERFALESYLAHLEQIAGESPRAIPDDHAAWFRVQGTVHHELLRYVEFLLRSAGGPAPREAAPGHFVCLLRDELLVYLALRRLQAAGRIQDVRALLVSRASLRACSPANAPERVYDAVLQTLYAEVRRRPAHGGELARNVARALETHPEPALGSALSVLRGQCARALGEGPYVAVDSGASGTMPLLLAAASPKVSGMRLYCAYPWLAPLYGSDICASSYQHLRDLEATACQEHLFAFDAVEGETTWIRERRDPTLRDIAYEELRRFSRAVDARFGLS